MPDDEVYVLRRTVAEQQHTIARLQAEVLAYRAAVQQHHNTKTTQVPVGGHHDVDRWLWDHLGQS